MPYHYPGDNKLGRFWLMPHNAEFYRLLTNLDEWKELLPLVDTLGFADHGIHNLFSSAEKEQGFRIMNELGIPLALETGAIKEWGGVKHGCYGKDMFAVSDEMWKSHIKHGAKLSAVAFDEPLVNVNIFPDVWDRLGDTEAKFEFAVEQTAEYIRLIQEEYPDMMIGDIEVYPHFGVDYVMRWVDALQDRLKQKSARPLDFFRMDVCWAAYVHNTLSTGENWLEIKKVEDHCKAMGLPFSLIYWGSCVGDFYIPDTRDPRDAETLNVMWNEQVLDQGAQYKAIGGNPDQFVVQCWDVIGDGDKKTLVPPATFPIAKANSYMGTAWEFYNRYVK